MDEQCTPDTLVIEFPCSVASLLVEWELLHPPSHRSSPASTYHPTYHIIPSTCYNVPVVSVEPKCTIRISGITLPAKNLTYTPPHRSNPLPTTLCTCYNVPVVLLEPNVSFVPQGNPYYHRTDTYLGSDRGDPLPTTLPIL